MARLSEIPFPEGQCVCVCVDLYADDGRSHVWWRVKWNSRAVDVSAFQVENVTLIDSDAPVVDAKKRTLS